MMLMKYLVLALLPATAYSQIMITVKAGRNMAQAEINGVGENIAVINDYSQKAFKLNNDTLKDASKEYKGERCDDVYLKPPTPWGDVYYVYDWNEVETVIIPVSGRIVEIYSEVVDVASTRYTNNHHDRNITYASRTMAEVKESVTHKWLESGQLKVDEDIQYTINFGKQSVGGINNLYYTSSWGTNTTQSRTILIGATTSTTVQVTPGETVLEKLRVIQGTMEVEIKYEVTLQGDVFCNYYHTYKGHHFYSFNIKNLQRYGNLSHSIEATERLRIRFYVYPKNILYSLESDDEILEIDAGIVDVEY